VQLQQTVKDLEERGIGLAAISYDPPATLKAFADQHGITFPLLSDTGSETIKRYDLLNTAATGGRRAHLDHPAAGAGAVRLAATFRPVSPSK
jgi:thioredoxin-dependent peroxiredoxin